MNGRAAILLALIVVGLFGFGFYKLALAPRYAEQAQLDEQITAQQQAATDAQAQLGTAREAKQRYPANAAAIVELGKAVPRDPDTGSLIFQLQAEARRAGVSLRTYTRTQGDPTAATGPAGVTAVPLRLTFRGDFFGLDRLLRRMRGFVSVTDAGAGIRGRLLVVDSLDLAPDNAEGGGGKIDAQIGVTAYVRDPDAAPAAAAAAPGAGTATETPPAPAPAAGATGVTDQ